MARVFIVERSDTKHIYTVEQSVGLGCPNVRDDVLLVQFFLRRAMDDSPESKGIIPPGERPISIDGISGPQTFRYIKHYQDEDNRRNPGRGVARDGRVDSVGKSGTGFGSISNTLYTIIALNVSYRQRKGILIADIRKDNLFPKDLVPSLYLFV